MTTSAFYLAGDNRPSRDSFVGVPSNGGGKGRFGYPHVEPRPVRLGDPVAHRSSARKISGRALWNGFKKQIN